MSNVHKPSSKRTIGPHQQRPHKKFPQNKPEKMMCLNRQRSFLGSEYLHYKAEKLKESGEITHSQISRNMKKRFRSFAFISTSLSVL